MTLRSISIRSRLILLVLAALVLLVAVAAYALFMEREQMLRDRQVKTRNIVEVAYTQVARYASLAESGKLSLPDAQEQARLTIRNIRYDGDNYLSVYDTGHNVIEHPIRPEMNGKNVCSRHQGCGRDASVCRHCRRRQARQG